MKHASHKRVEPSNGTPCTFRAHAAPKAMNLASLGEVYFGSDDGFVYSVSESALANRKTSRSDHNVTTTSGPPIKSEVMVTWHGASMHPPQSGPNPCSAMTRTGGPEMKWGELKSDGEKDTMNNQSSSWNQKNMSNPEMPWARHMLFWDWIVRLSQIIPASDDRHQSIIFHHEYFKSLHEQNRCCSAVAMAFSMHWANDWAPRTGSSMSSLLSTLLPLCTEVGLPVYNCDMHSSNRHPRSFRKQNEIIYKESKSYDAMSCSTAPQFTFRLCVLWQRERQDVRSQRVNRRGRLDLRCLQSNSLPESASVDFGFVHDRGFGVSTR